jgi:hypothetical protein
MFISLGSRCATGNAESLLSGHPGAVQISRFLRRSLFGGLLEAGVPGSGSPAGHCRARARSRSVGCPSRPSTPR